MGDIMDLLMNGGIYIKIRPSNGTIDDEETDQFLESEEDNPELDFIKSELGDQFDDIIAMAFERFYDLFPELNLDWTGCDSFWTLKETDKGIIMNECPLTGKGIQKEYESREDISKEFISLNSFLENGKYVGKFFRRTKLVNPEDKELLPVNHKIFALYENSGTILAVKDSNGKNEFRVISKKYTEDNNYEYYGDKKLSFDDEKEIKKAITKQLTYNNKNRL
jgi:hypothetical protein